MLKATPTNSIFQTCRDIEKEAADLVIPRDKVKEWVLAAFDLHVAPLIRQYDPIGPDEIYIKILRKLTLRFSLLAYDRAKQCLNNSKQV